MKGAGPSYAGGHSETFFDGYRLWSFLRLFHVMLMIASDSRHGQYRRDVARFLTTLSGAIPVVESSQYSIGFETDFSILKSWDDATRTEYRPFRSRSPQTFWIDFSHGERVGKTPNSVPPTRGTDFLGIEVELTSQSIIDFDAVPAKFVPDATLLVWQLVRGSRDNRPAGVDVDMTLEALVQRVTKILSLGEHTPRHSFLPSCHVEAVGMWFTWFSHQLLVPTALVGRQ